MKTNTRGRLLVIGGYGTFGGRLVRLLADHSGLIIMIGGRSLHKAQQFATGISGAATILPVLFERDGNVARQVARLAPDIVVDASGPYQAYGDHPYRVAEAAIAIGAHYLDLADGTDFVRNIGTLNAAAVDKGVFVLSGASTCPVLTTVVARKLGSDLVRIDMIAGGIAPSPFAGMGRSVVEAIAGYAGKPVVVIRDGQPATEHTFVSTKKFTIAPPGIAPLAPMTFSLIDVPDLRLLGELDQAVGNTWFGVATTPAVYHRFLRFLARLVKLRILPTLQPLAGAMHFVMNQLGWGEHRGGMFVTVRGVDRSGKNMRRSWHMIAEGDKGPDVPALAANAIIRRWLAGRAPDPGARPAANELDLSEYLAMFASLGIKAGTRNVTDEPLSIFRSVLGCALDTLPQPVRSLHDTKATTMYSGRASVRRGSSVMARLIGAAARLPVTACDIPVSVRIIPRGQTETWERNFDDRRFASVLRAGQGRFEGLICEQFGPCQFGIALVTDGRTLRWQTKRWSCFGIPMPKWMLPKGDMHETVVDDKFTFHVEIRLPCIGHLVTYKGWLQ